MKRVLIIFITICLATASFSNDKTVPKLSSPYLGQNPPGMTPEIFAPGIISFGYHEHGITISPDGNEIFFVARRMKNGIELMYLYTQLDNKAKYRKKEMFAEKWHPLLMPVISPVLTILSYNVLYNQTAN